MIGKLFSWDGGGYTGNGARSGGVDGKGGFLAVMHPRETVIDHTKGGGMGVSLTIVNNGAPVSGAITNNGTGPDGTQLLELVLNAVADGIGHGSGPVARAMEGRYGLRTSVA